MSYDPVTECFAEDFLPGDLIIAYAVIDRFNERFVSYFNPRLFVIGGPELSPRNDSGYIAVRVPIISGGKVWTYTASEGASKGVVYLRARL